MQTVGWAAAAVLFLGGIFWVLGYVCEQVPELCRKIVIVIVSVREVRSALKGEIPEHMEHCAETMRETTSSR